MKGGGLKRQVVSRFIVVVLLTLLLVETLLVLAVRQYYYSSVETVLEKHASVSLSFYSKYTSLFYTTFKQNLNDMIVKFAHESAELEIIDKEGNVLMTSSGFVPGSEVRKTSDVRHAVNGESGTWIGHHPVTGEKVMAVSTPIAYNGQTLAVLRYVTSLAEVDRVLLRLLLLSIGMGLIVLVVVFLVSLSFAGSLVKPIKRITAASAEMARGRFDVRVDESERNEIGELAKTLNFMASEIVRSEGLKSDFISSISHEIRTPLSSIKGWSETIVTGDMQDEQETRQGLGIISRETDRLIGLVEELLDFSRLDQKRIALDMRSVPIVAVLEEVVLQLRSKADKKKLLVLPPAGLGDELRGVAVAGDPNRLKQVLLNLVDNAIKFSRVSGTITLAIERAGLEAVVSVADNGIGIDPEQLPRIEAKFYQVNPLAEGTGLGLSICREIVSLHGGRLEFASEPGQGTTVTLALPLYVPPVVESAGAGAVE